MVQMILGSQSPRRREIMGQFNIPLELATPPFIEESVPFKGDPIEYVNTLSKGKATSLHQTYPHATILTADTIVYHRGKVYNKPQDIGEAISFLKTYSNTWQSVFTSVTVRRGDEEYVGVEETKVLFNPLTPFQINRFLECINWRDKGGGYTIQGIGSLLINRIDGCYYNVTGLPINTVHSLLNQVGIDLWHYVK